MTDEPDRMTAEERRKYRKMWDLPSYRLNSPGLNIAPRAAKLMGILDGEDIVDWGCGEGKAMDWFNAQGYRSVGVDIVKLRDGVVEGCLWEDIPGIDDTDWSFCADVMEHIPPERVDDVLSNIRSRTALGAAFTIATVPCKQGKRAGETLHLTLRSKEWWEAKLREHWKSVEHYSTDRDWRHLFIVR